MSKQLGQVAPTTHCRRCKLAYAEHIESACPDGSGRTWLAHSDRGRASTSFSAKEVALLNDMLLGVTQRKDLSLLAKRFEFTDVARKIKRLAATSTETAKRPVLSTTPRDVERLVKRSVASRLVDFTTRDVAQEIGKSVHTVSSALSRMKGRGEVIKVKHGIWRKAPVARNVVQLSERKVAVR